MWLEAGFGGFRAHAGRGLPSWLVSAGSGERRHGGGRGRRGGGGGSILCLLKLSLELLADAGLQGGRGQPLFGQAALEEGYAGAEVGQPVHPAGDLPATQDLRWRKRETERNGARRGKSKGEKE